MRNNIGKIEIFAKVLWLMLLILGGCSEEPQELPVKSKDLVITDFVASTPEFQSWIKF
jgi:hypothetical protein